LLGGGFRERCALYLKSLTLRGFKSFASSTTLRFEPGITCVVGPNGSGKSNVVDAIAWVLGEQGAKALRGGKMEDVIFAGTPGRPPLGRAEVVLTIDNSDGALPIEYAEVSVSRLMYRSGESEYSINGHGCRLLDVQELLSDSGIGRELHVIVGQGQLDAVLSARPEDRRGFIEEAAGVLKHRKRKEKTLRKLEAMSGNLTRITDITAELRRQLKPLGQQAEVARRAAAVQADLRDARLRLLADDLLTMRGALAAEVRDETLVRERRAAVEAELATVQQAESELEQAGADAPRLARAQESWYRLAALEERFRGTASLAAERRRLLEADLDDPGSGRDPAVLDAEAASLQDEQTAVSTALDVDRVRLAEVVAARADLETALAAEERSLVAAARAEADRREELARLVGQVGALRSRAAAAEAETGRLAVALADARARAEQAQAEVDVLQNDVGVLDEGELGLDERYEAAQGAVRTARRWLAELQAEEREADRERSSWAARRDALAMGLARKDGAGALLSADHRLPGMLGSVAALLTVETGHEAALAAALGAVADAVAVASPADAARALELLKADDAGRAGLLVGATPVDEAALPSLPELPHGAGRAGARRSGGDREWGSGRGALGRRRLGVLAQRAGGSGRRRRGRQCPHGCRASVRAVALRARRGRRGAGPDRAGRRSRPSRPERLRRADGSGRRAARPVGCGCPLRRGRGRSARARAAQRGAEARGRPRRSGRNGGPAQPGAQRRRRGW